MRSASCEVMSFGRGGPKPPLPFVPHLSRGQRDTSPANLREGVRSRGVGRLRVAVEQVGSARSRRDSVLVKISLKAKGHERIGTLAKAPMQAQLRQEQAHL